VKVEAFSEPVILSGDLDNLAAMLFIREARSIETKPRCVLAAALGLCQ
jgi:hypothetical protein